MTPKDGKIRVYCPAGFKYNPVVNEVRCYLNGINITAVVSALVTAAYAGDAYADDESVAGFMRLKPYDPAAGWEEPTMLVDGAESFGLSDFACCVGDFIALDCVAMEDDYFHPIPYPEG
jgi:hypothetical protein